MTTRTAVASREADSGFTLIELVVSMGVLVVLMMIVSLVMANGLSVARGLNDLTVLQGAQQNTSEWMSRAIRYADNPYESAITVPAVASASRLATGEAKLDFYTFAGVGAVERVPYRVVISQNASNAASNPKAVVATVQQVTTPVSGTTPTPVGNPVTRILLQRSAKHTPALSFDYLFTVPTSPDTCASLYSATLESDGLWCRVTLAPGASLSAAQIASLAAVRFTLSDTTPSATVTQTVVLENPRTS